MRTYVIRTPEKLEEAVGMIKWERDAKRVRAAAKAWKDGSNVPERVILELSHNAHIFAKDAGNKTLLGTMYVAAAREYVKGLSEA